MRAIWANGPFRNVPYDGFLKALMQLAAKESLLQPGKDECCRTFLKRVFKPPGCVFLYIKL